MLARAPHDGAADIDLLHTGREHAAPVVELAQQEFDPAEGARGVPRDHLWAKTVRLFRPAPSVSLAQCSNGFGPRSCQGNCTGITRWPSLPSPPKSADALITFSSTSTRTPTGSGPRSCWRCVQRGPGSPSSATTRSRSIRFAPRPCAYPRLSARRFAAGRGLRARTQLSINAADPRCRHPALGREPARCGGGLQGHPASTRRRPGTARNVIDRLSHEGFAVTALTRFTPPAAAVPWAGVLPHDRVAARCRYPVERAGRARP
jgi:hypothetical protein